MIIKVSSRDPGSMLLPTFSKSCNGYYATKMSSFYYGITGCQIGHSYFDKLAYQPNVQISDILNLLATLL